MPNVNKPFGLRPLNKLGSNYDSQGGTQYRIASGTATAIFQGDTVTFGVSGSVSTGYIVKHTPGSPNILGVFLGCQYTDPTTKKVRWSNFYPGNVSADDIVAFIVDDPNCQFLIQASGVAGNACVGQNANLVQTVAGNTTSGVSGLELNTATLGAASDLNVKVVGISAVPGENDVTSANANLIVIINEHLYRGATAGVS